MPVIMGNYVPPGIFKSGDASTIYAATLRKVEIPVFERERIELSDGDFIDIDWSYTKQRNSENLVILLHGLAGKADRPYMKGMARAIQSRELDRCGHEFSGLQRGT